jgi:hypothetical protein
MTNNLPSITVTLLSYLYRIVKRLLTSCTQFGSDREQSRQGRREHNGRAQQGS